MYVYSLNKIHKGSSINFIPYSKIQGNSGKFISCKQLIFSIVIRIYVRNLAIQTVHDSQRERKELWLSSKEDQHVPEETVHSHCLHSVKVKRLFLPPPLKPPPRCQLLARETSRYRLDDVDNAPEELSFCPTRTMNLSWV